MATPFRCNAKTPLHAERCSRHTEIGLCKLEGASLFIPSGICTSQHTGIGTPFKCSGSLARLDAMLAAFYDDQFLCELP
jgi:hypothetical protein